MAQPNIEINFDPITDRRDAMVLGHQIQTYWKALGWHKLKVWIEIGGHEELPVYSIRSNMVGGLPPGPRYTA